MLLPLNIQPVKNNNYSWAFGLVAGRLTVWKGQKFILIEITTYSKYMLAFPALRDLANTTVCGLM